MRKLLMGLAVAVAGLALAGCGGNGDAGEPQSEGAFDRAFIDAMVPHHEEAIAAAKAAKEAGLTQADLVQIADDVIAAQQAEIDRMLEWRADWYGSGEVDPAGAAAMGMSMEEMGMQHDPGDLSVAADVDSAFASMMIDHHAGAIQMAKLALEQAEHPEIRQLAEAIIQAQEGEIAIMEEHAGMTMDHS